MFVHHLGRIIAGMRHVTEILVEMAEPMYRVALAAAAGQDMSLEQFVRNSVAANIRAQNAKNAPPKGRIFKIIPRGS